MILLKSDMPEIQLLTGRLKEDKEAFRGEAIEAYTNYTPRDRSLAGAVASPHATIHEVLMAWEQVLFPAYEALEANFAKPAFRKLLSKQLLLQEGEVSETLDQLKEARYEELLDSTLFNLYPEEAHKKPRQSARAFLLCPHDEIEAFNNRYLSFQAYFYVATTQQVAVYDPYAGWWKRQKTIRRIAKDHKKVTKHDRKRQVQIDKRLKELDSAQHGLLGTLAAKGWNLVVVVDLRNKYDKQLKELSTVETKKGTKRLKLYEDITREFKDKELEKIASHVSGGLNALYKAANEIDSLLLHLFDLSNAQKNQLFLQMKEYRLLTQEKAKLAENKETRRLLKAKLSKV